MSHKHHFEPKLLTPLCVNLGTGWVQGWNGGHSTLHIIFIHDT